MTTTQAPKLVYVTQIRTTPAQLWHALTDSDFSTRYWFGARCSSSWKQGEHVECRFPDGELAWEGKILSSTPEKEVVFSFDHHMDEPASTVRFQMEAVSGQEGLMQLSIIHEDFVEGSKVRERVSGGWPTIIANIKSLLETGELAIEGSTCTHD